MINHDPHLEPARALVLRAAKARLALSQVWLIDDGALITYQVAWRYGAPGDAPVCTLFRKEVQPVAAAPIYHDEEVLS
jgi:hypothetical protein